MEKCITCHFYDRRSSRAVDGRTPRAGQCRRSAPMLHPAPGKTYQIEGVWPTVRDDDWCGEWKILPRRPGHALSASQPQAVAGATTEVLPIAIVARSAAGSPAAPALADTAEPCDQAVAMAAD